MEQLYSPEEMVHQLDCPAFIARKGCITAVNAEAQKLLFEPGIHIDNCICSGYEEYKQLVSGCIMVSVELNRSVFECAVTIYEDHTLFKPKPTPEPAELQVLTLAAELLRIPFSDLNLILDRIKGIPAEQRARLNHNLYKIYRLLSNMSDTAMVDSGKPRMTVCNIPEVLNESVEKAIALLKDQPVDFSYCPSELQIFAKGNPDLIKRSVYNLISNAVKFAEEGSQVDISLKRIGNRLYFTVTNTGSIISPDIFPTVFDRYHRIAGLEDPRNGLGLGISLIYATAKAHHGTLMIETPDHNTTRVTMVLGIVKDDSTELHSPILRHDLYGGRDQALIELSDILSYLSYME